MATALAGTKKRPGCGEQANLGTRAGPSGRGIGDWVVAGAPWVRTRSSPRKGVCWRWAVRAGLQADQRKRPLRFACESPQLARDVLCTGQAEQRDGEVSQDRHHSGTVAGSDLAAVLVEGDIPHPVASVLDAPVATVDGQQARWISLLWLEARDQVGDLTGRLAALNVSDIPLYLGDLAAVGEVKVVVEFSRGPDPAFLDASVSLVQASMLRGKKTRLQRGWRCRL